MATPNDASLYVAKEDAGRYKCALCMDSSFKHQYLAIQHVNRVHLGNFVVYKPNTVEARFILMQERVFFKRTLPLFQMQGCIPEVETCKPY